MLKHQHSIKNVSIEKALIPQSIGVIFLVLLSDLSFIFIFLSLLSITFQSKMLY